MKIITSTDFRKNMATTLDEVSGGETVLIRRGKQLFRIVKIEETDIEISK